MDSASSRVMILKLTPVWRILISVFAIVGAVAFVSLPAIWLFHVPRWSPLQCALLVLGAAVLVFTLWALPKFTRYQIEIHPGFVRYQGAFSATELRIEDIEGYRLLPTQYIETLLLTPKTRAHKKLQLALVYQRKPELLAWLAANLADLDLREQKAAMEEVLADANLGATETERRNRLANARKWTRTLNAIAYLALAWGIFRPHPYLQSMGLLIALPPIALLAVVLSRGAIRFDGKKSEPHPTVAIAFIMPALALFLRAFLDWEILQFTDLVEPVLILGISLLAAVWLAAANLRRSPAMLISAGLMGLLYSYGSVVHINCAYDRSEPLVYESVVRDAHISKGRSTSYRITLRPFVDEIPSREMEVSKKVYLAHPVGSPIQIHVREGKLGIAWFLVR